MKKLINTKNNKIAKYHQLNYLGTKNDLFRIENFYDHSLTLKKLIDSKKINQLLKLINKKMILFKEKINIKPTFSRKTDCTKMFRLIGLNIARILLQF